MEINATIIGQMITFVIFVWFTMQFVVPPLGRVISERQQKIAEGIAASERAKQDLDIMQAKVKKALRESHEKVQQIIDDAEKQAAGIIEDAKKEALHEQAMIIKQGHEENLQERLRIKQELKKELVNLVVLGTEKLLRRSIVAQDNKELINIRDNW